MSIVRTSLVLLMTLSAPGALAVTLGDRIEAECSFVNTGEIQSDVTVTVECRQAMEELTPLLEDLSEANDERVRLSGELKATEAMVTAALIIVGENNVPQEKRAERVVEIIQQQKKTIKSLRSEARGDAPDRDRLRIAAADAIEAGEPGEADDLLAELEEKEEGLKLEEELLVAASTKAERGRVAMSELRYLDAARHFDAAANKTPRSFEGTFLDYLDEAASAYSREGNEFGNNDAAAEAIKRHRELLDLYPRQHAPHDWAKNQNDLGNALSILGERESGTERLEQAVDAYHAALEERTRERVPLGWATTQNNLGNALQALGERESGTERLEQAVDAYHAALEERTRERVPLDWATTQNNLGVALRTLSERESGTERLEQAVDAYHAALEERTRERVPLDWATTHSNLGVALEALGERESGTERLEQAINAFNAALEERTRERVPLYWAETQNNLGNAFRILGSRQSGTERLEQAVDAYHAALEESTRERVPLRWAMTQGNLGSTLEILGRRESSVKYFYASLEATKNAYHVYVKEAGQSQYENHFVERIAEIETAIERLKSKE